MSARAGTGANIFRGHCNVQGATDLGLDVVTLPLYYGLAEGAWQHWSRVWEVDYEWLTGSRFDDASDDDEQRRASRSTRWLRCRRCCRRTRLQQKDNMKAMIVFGHGGNTVTRMPEAAKGIEKLDLLVVADPHPTTWAVLRPSARTAPICCRSATQLRDATARAPPPTARSSGASRSSSRSSNRRTTTRSCTCSPKKARLRRPDVQEHQGREQSAGRRETSCARSIAAAGRPAIAASRRSGSSCTWPTRRTSTCVTLRAKAGPGQGRLSTACRGPAGARRRCKHPGTPILYNTNLPVKEGGGTFRARFGVEREEKRRTARP